MHVHVPTQDKSEATTSHTHHLTSMNKYGSVPWVSTKQYGVLRLPCNGTVFPPPAKGKIIFAQPRARLGPPEGTPTPKINPVNSAGWESLAPKSGVSGVLARFHTNPYLGQKSGTKTEPQSGPA
jgi:hypothetical protein